MTDKGAWRTNIHRPSACCRIRCLALRRSAIIAHLVQLIWTTSFSISSANPFSRGSAIIVNLFLPDKNTAEHPLKFFPSSYIKIWRVGYILFVGCFGKAFERGCLHDCLTECNYWISHLDLCRKKTAKKYFRCPLKIYWASVYFTYFGVHFSEVMHDTVKIELSRTKYDMFTRFLNLWGCGWWGCEMSNCVSSLWCDKQS